MKHINDEALRFVQQYEPLIWKIARSFAQSSADQEDLFQEISISLWSGHGRIPGDKKEMTYVYRIALNRAISWQRQRNTYLHHIAEFFRLMPRRRTAFPPPDSDEQIVALYSAIRKLSPADRSVVLLYLEHKPYAEMGEILGLSETVVAKRLSRARTKLANIVRAETENES